MVLSKAFRWICLFFIFGVFLSSFAILPANVWMVFLIVGLIVTVFGLKKSFIDLGKDWRFLIAGCAIIFLALGILRNDLFLSRKESISQIPYQKDVALEGSISKDPDWGVNNQKIEVAVSYQYSGQAKQEMFGKILLTLDRNLDLRYGDRILVEGKLKAPLNTDGFSYKNYLAMQGIYALSYFPKITIIERGGGNPLMVSLLSWRDSFEGKINAILPEPQSSFLAGLLLGAKKNMSAEVLDDFNRTGTTHIVAISGYNITVVAVVFVGFLLALGLARPKAFYFAVLGIIFFTLITGASASVVRASIMGILILVAQKIGRLSIASNAIIFAGTIMIAINPSLLRFDVGFQLSFLATLSLIYLAPWLEEVLKWLPNYLELRTVLVATLSAQIAVLPILLYNFGQISIIAPLVNLLILPAVPLAMFLGFIASVLAFFWLPIGKLFGLLSWLVLTYQLKIVHLFSQLPIAVWQPANVGLFWCVVYYLVIIFIVWRFLYRQKMQLVPQQAKQ